MYDPIVAITCREKTFKKYLIEQLDIQPGYEILDLGCGTGTFAIQIKESGPDARAVSIGGDPQILGITIKKGKRAAVEIDFRYCFTSDLPFPDHTFDKVFSNLFFHQLDNI